MNTLDALARNTPARIVAINWNSLNTSEARRMREFGFETGAQVETLNRGGLFGRDPIACKVGRMTIALRKTQAAAVEIETL